MFIVLEGLDACGKGTQAVRLMDLYPSERFIKFPTYDTEPDGACGPVLTDHMQGRWSAMWHGAERNKKFVEACSSPHTLKDDSALDAFVFQCVMVANKYEMAPAIEAAINKNQHIICDRYWPSAYAYGGADGLDLAWLHRVHSTLPTPDVAILLDIDYEQSVERRPDRRDRFETKGKAYFDRVAGLYRKLWLEIAPLDRFWGGHLTKWVVVDGRRDVDLVTDDVFRAIRS